MSEEYNYLTRAVDADISAFLVWVTRCPINNNVPHLLRKLLIEWTAVQFTWTSWPQTEKKKKYKKLTKREQEHEKAEETDLCWWLPPICRTCLYRGGCWSDCTECFWSWAHHEDKARCYRSCASVALPNNISLCVLGCRIVKVLLQCCFWTSTSGVSSNKAKRYFSHLYQWFNKAEIPTPHPNTYSPTLQQMRSTFIFFYQKKIKEKKSIKE